MWPFFIGTFLLSLMYYYFYLIYLSIKALHVTESRFHFACIRVRIMKHSKYNIFVYIPTKCISCELLIPMSVVIIQGLWLSFWLGRNLESFYWFQWNAQGHAQNSIAISLRFCTSPESLIKVQLEDTSYPIRTCNLHTLPF